MEIQVRLDENLTKTKNNLKPQPVMLAKAKQFSQIMNQQNPPSIVDTAPKTTLTQTPKPIAQINLGTISNGNPTVSNLLIKNDQYGKEVWKIIHSDINKDKAFTRIQPGMAVYLDPNTKELSWKKDSQPSQLASKNPMTQAFHQQLAKINNTEHNDHTDGLSNAVKPYMGTSYNDINCYGLLIRGLKNMGVKYKGEGGLRNHLKAMAKAENKPMNAYFNGEGISKASGVNIYNKAVINFKDPVRQAESVFNDIQPILKKGDILSFSIHTKGHTGIISQKNDEWTYINSGTMDNSVQKTHKDKGVGEEHLRAEIKNWFNLAAERNESLKITIGRLQDQKMAAFMPDRKIRNV